MIDQKEIGKRISRLRKLKEMSQDELAKHIGIPRSSIVQIEAGNRNLSVIELMGLSRVLNFSLDRFVSKDFQTEEEVELSPMAKKKKKEMRISVPELKVDKFRNVLLYILEKCAGKPNVGETVLYKLLYFSDFNFYELYEEHLTGAEYRKLDYGPVPQKLNTILSKMLENGEIKRIKTKYHGYPQTRYIPLERSNLQDWSAAEKETIDWVIHRFGDWTASNISEYSHADMPWKATKDGDVIDYELVFYRDAPYSVRKYDSE